MVVFVVAGGMGDWKGVEIDLEGSVACELGAKVT